MNNFSIQVVLKSSDKATGLKSSFVSAEDDFGTKVVLKSVTDDFSTKLY